MVFVKFSGPGCRRVSSQRRPRGIGSTQLRWRVIVVEPLPVLPVGPLSVWLSPLLRASQLRRSENRNSPQRPGRVQRRRICSGNQKGPEVTLRPGKHQIELRDPDGQTAVTIGKNDQAAGFVNELALATFLTIVARS
jgi:hypothetical protein